MADDKKVSFGEKVANLLFGPKKLSPNPAARPSDTAHPDRPISEGFANNNGPDLNHAKWLIEASQDAQKPTMQLGDTGKLADVMHHWFQQRIETQAKQENAEERRALFKVTDSFTFSAPLAYEVWRYQQEKGLPANGVLDPATLDHILREDLQKKTDVKTLSGISAALGSYLTVPAAALPVEEPATLAEKQQELAALKAKVAEYGPDMNPNEHKHFRLSGNYKWSQSMSGNIRVVEKDPLPKEQQDFVRHQLLYPPVDKSQLWERIVGLYELRIAEAQNKIAAQDAQTSKATGHKTWHMMDKGDILYSNERGAFLDNESLMAREIFKGAVNDGHDELGLQLRELYAYAIRCMDGGAITIDELPKDLRPIAAELQEYYSAKDRIPTLQAEIEAQKNLPSEEKKNDEPPLEIRPALPAVQPPLQPIPGPRPYGGNTPHAPDISAQTAEVALASLGVSAACENAKNTLAFTQGKKDMPRTV